MEGIIQPPIPLLLRGMIQMQLSYRGVGYRLRSTTVPVMELDHSGQYRGQPIAFRRMIQRTIVPDSVICLRYRGVPYLGCR